MITLYHRPKTRSTRFIFLLEELAVPYEIRIVTTRNRDGTGAVDPANPHPHGKVPAISDDGIVVFESPAIALYLTDKYPEKKLGPLVAERGRGAYLSWLSYYTGVLEPAFMSKFMNMEVPRGTAGWVAVEEALPAVIGATALARTDNKRADGEPLSARGTRQRRRHTLWHDVCDVRPKPDAGQIPGHRGLCEANRVAARLRAGAGAGRRVKIARLDANG